jgi:outer membrane protein assembly factor BamB
LNRSFSPPAIAHDGTIYFGSEDRHLYAINRDGSQRWRFGTGGQARSPSIGLDGTIYFANDRVESLSAVDDTALPGSKLFALNPDGTERWSAVLEGPIGASPVAIGFDGTIYVTSGQGIYAFDPAGSLLAKHLPGSGQTPIVAGDGSIYVVSRYIYALDALGGLKWEYQMKNGTGTAPAIGFDGTIYAGANDYSSSPYHVLAFVELGGNNGGYHASPWPQERGDRANTGRARARP